MSAGQHRAYRPDARTERAAALLADLNGEQTSSIILTRLSGPGDKSGGLPPCERGEDPTAIFIDVIRLADQSCADKIRVATVQALRKVALGPTPNADVLGDLCYLTAALGAYEGIDVLAGILRREGSDGMSIWTGEPVKRRALRALVGLLATSANPRSSDVKGVLVTLLGDPQYRILALTGLVGVWPEEDFQLNDADRKELSLSLELADFGSQAKSRAI